MKAAGYCFLFVSTLSLFLSCTRGSTPCRDLYHKPTGEIVSTVYFGNYMEDAKLSKDTLHIANDTALKKLFGWYTSEYDQFVKYSKIDFSKHNILVINYYGANWNSHNLRVTFNHQDKKVLFEAGELVCPGGDNRCELCTTKFMTIAVKIPAIPPGYEIIYDHYRIEGN